MTLLNFINNNLKPLKSLCFGKHLNRAKSDHVGGIKVNEAVSYRIMGVAKKKQ